MEWEEWDTKIIKEETKTVLRKMQNETFLYEINDEWTRKLANPIISTFFTHRLLLKGFEFNLQNRLFLLHTNNTFSRTQTEEDWFGNDNSCQCNVYQMFISFHGEITKISCLNEMLILNFRGPSFILNLLYWVISMPSLFITWVLGVAAATFRISNKSFINSIYNGLKDVHAVTHKKTILMALL